MATYLIWICKLSHTDGLFHSLQQVGVELRLSIYGPPALHHGKEHVCEVRGLKYIKFIEI